METSCSKQGRKTSDDKKKKNMNDAVKAKVSKSRCDKIKKIMGACFCQQETKTSDGKKRKYKNDGVLIFSDDWVDCDCGGCDGCDCDCDCGGCVDVCCGIEWSGCFGD